MSVEKLANNNISHIDNSSDDLDENSLLTPDEVFNDEEAFTLLWRINMRFIPRIVGPNTFTQEDIEDLCQQTFEKAWNNRASFEKERGNFVNWLLQIAHNTVVDEIRKRKRRPQAESKQSNHYRYNVDDNFEDPEDILDQQASYAPTPEEIVIAKEEADSVHEALGALPDGQRDVIELNFFQELSDREIAQRTTLPLGTVKTRRRLGLMKLRTSLREAVE